MQKRCSSARLPAANLAGALSPDQLPDRIEALQAELKDAKKRLKAGGGAGAGMPRPGDLKDRVETFDGVSESSIVPSSFASGE